MNTWFRETWRGWTAGALLLGVCAIGGGAALPQVAPVPAQVQPGGQLTLHISGFSPNSLLTIQLDAARISTMADYTDVKGAHDEAVTVPATLSAGAHRVVVTDVYNHRAETTVTVQGKSLTPTLHLAPVTGGPGQAVAITGSNWDRRQHFVTMQDGAGHAQTLFATDGCLMDAPPSDPKQGQACAPGELHLVATIPKDARSGPYLIIVSDGMVQASAAFRVVGGVDPTPVTNAAIVLQPASGPARSSITVSGSGFPKSAQVTVSWDPTGANSRQGAIRTDTQGRFSGLVFQVPVDAAQGTYTVAGLDAANARATARFTVIAEKAGPGPTPGPTPVPQPTPQACNPNAPMYTQPGCIAGGGPTPPSPPPANPAPASPACNPNAPSYTQPGCGQGGGGTSPTPSPAVPNPPAKKCDPNTPRYSQPGCVSGD